uniref:NADH dehydrogenase subunit 6 n=1 Tax=Conus mercator TaxID=289040 RepID=A0A1W6ETL7_CONMK|nr:NADH dehydrogenase subunit 6 [Varioconus mercator]ARK18750.1 NADH dehydrogenase subunit 6 [Varioconus mercator]ARK18763.1 NADH dehydrogenase subunit 6 [Varioconus mercator]QLH57070.1 NADH dehydrogenase subunit 6 [Varioconus mercator]QLH57083.1 NADH dehydrogenase subunit 6 [Varioconus mercator]
MSSLLIITLTSSTLLILPMMSQPLSLGLVIMISTLFMCLVSGMTTSAWYGYILFLIYVGGLLVMFAYVAALSPNVLFGGLTPLFSLIMFFPILFVLFYFYFFKDSSYLSFEPSFSKFVYLKMYGVELISPYMISILIGLGTVLLINLIVVAKICYYQQASLRPFSV